MLRFGVHFFSSSLSHEEVIVFDNLDRVCTRDSYFMQKMMFVV